MSRSPSPILDEEVSSVASSRTSEEPRETHYALGVTLRGGFPVVAACVPTDRGWSCRSNYSDVLRHDYECRESVHELEEWFLCDLRNSFEWTLDREEALERLTTILETGAALRHPRSVVGRLDAVPEDAAERVLRHLEHGL